MFSCNLLYQKPKQFKKQKWSMEKSIKASDRNQQPEQLQIQKDLAYPESHVHVLSRWKPMSTTCMWSALIFMLVSSDRNPTPTQS